MVISQFNGVLRRLGVVRVDAASGAPFQPELHEAMLHTPTDVIDVGHIVQEISAGYSLNGRLLRAARVSVAAALAAESSDSPQLLEADPESESAQEGPAVSAQDGLQEE
jgi:molecular chaperone GrpE